MGCMSSKADINDRHSNIFQVVNIDDLGHELRPAKLEITDQDIILHQRGRSAVRWPIRCLKRYGYSEGVFSFELGRRCPTGAGVYAFRCDRAEALFQLLQSCIQQPGEQGRPPAPSAAAAANGPPLAAPANANGEVAALRAWHGPADGSEQAVYVNEEVWSEEAAAPPAASAAPAADPSSPAAAAAPAPAPAQQGDKLPPVPAQRKSRPVHSYLNTVTCDINTNYAASAEEDQRHLYVNVVPDTAAAAAAASAEEDERCYVNIAGSSGAARLVNYAVLDLQTGGPRGEVAPPAAAAAGAGARPGQGYATIDFDKTAALSLAVNQRVEPEEEVADCRRKTRHNSTIGEPANLSRHNSVIST